MVIEKNLNEMNKHQELLNKNTVLQVRKRDYAKEIADCMDALEDPEISLEKQKYLQIKVRALLEEQEEELNFSLGESLSNKHK